MFDIDISQQLGDFQLQVQLQGNDGVCALFGHSGAGKSCVINMISGLTAPDSGHIRVAGRTLFDSKACINVATHKRRIGYVFQQPRLFPHLKVRRNLFYGQRFAPKNTTYTNPHELIDLLGIEPLLDKRPAQLSGGECQRIAIGRALLANPRLLLMDEPLSALDQPRKQEILPYIEKLKHLKIPIVYVSHDLSELKRLADQLIVMRAGRIIDQGLTATVCRRLAKSEAMDLKRYPTPKDTPLHISIAKSRLSQRAIDDAK